MPFENAELIIEGEIAQEGSTKALGL